MKIVLTIILLAILLLGLAACSGRVDSPEQTQPPQCETTQEETIVETTTTPNDAQMPGINPGETAMQISKYVDENGCLAIVPKDFTVSAKDGEHTVNTGVVVIGPDGSEFVWVPTTKTPLAFRDFGSYVSSTRSSTGTVVSCRAGWYRSM